MAVNSSIKVGPSVLLLQMFVIKENIMKRPVFKTFSLYAICYYFKAYYELP